MKPMTNRERILAVVRGEPLDRVPFVQYSNIAAPNEEIWAEIGRENMGVMRWTSIHRVERPNCTERKEPIERNGLKGERKTIETPRGALTQMRLFEPNLGTGSTKEHFVKTPEDYDILCAWIEDGTVVEDLTALHTNREELGDDGVPLVRVNRTPFQQLWVEWVSIEDLAVHMVECPDTVERVVALLAAEERKVFDIVERAPLDFINFPDNITAPIIGERYFRKYCLPLYRELADRLADRDIPVFCHMDGDLKPLWGAIGESGLRGIDSFSPPPDNDTSPAEALSLWPEMRLFLNFPSSVHIGAPERIYERAAQILEEAGHSGRLQIQISENVPPGVWRKSYPEIVRAISDFGRP